MGRQQRRWVYIQDVYEEDKGHFIASSVFILQQRLDFRILRFFSQQNQTTMTKCYIKMTQKSENLFFCRISQKKL